MEYGRFTLRNGYGNEIWTILEGFSYSQIVGLIVDKKFAYTKHIMMNISKLQYVYGYIL